MCRYCLPDPILTFFSYGDELDDRSHRILVTRHDFNHFSVALSSDVPFELIHEHDQVRRN
jgi:hypothetical protein